jgi:hypothetical protein
MVAQIMRSRLKPMKKIARSLRQHRELILNYFWAQKQISSGVVEGQNRQNSRSLFRDRFVSLLICILHLCLGLSLPSGLQGTAMSGWMPR